MAFLRNLLILAFLSLLSFHAWSAKMYMCKDDKGNPMFTQTRCDDSSNRRVIDVPPVQAPFSGLRSAEVHRLNQIRRNEAIFRARKPSGCRKK